MSPLTPHWAQPSHPDIQEVIFASGNEFLTKSISKVSLPPFAVYAKMSFPPCTMADEPTYATVQCGRDAHLNLNSDMLYINHSCDPSLCSRVTEPVLMPDVLQIFDTGNFNILVGPKGLRPGDELTFFYPSTEWSMAQPFDCFCGAASCRGTISGARDMTPAQLDGIWLNGHIRDLKDEQCRAQKQNGTNGVHKPATHGDDPTATALREALRHAEKGANAARVALLTYEAAAARRGATSRELSGEMGGDTRVAV